MTDSTEVDARVESMAGQMVVAWVDELVAKSEHAMGVWTVAARVYSGAGSSAFSSAEWMVGRSVVQRAAVTVIWTVWQKVVHSADETVAQ